MRIYAKIYSIIAVALGAFNACSLIHDDPEDCQLYTSEGVPYAYVAVAFNTGMNTSTRADENDPKDPTGGEDGDGPEDGQSNENQVNDITLFFYEATDEVKGINSDPETKIVAWHHFKSEYFAASPSDNHQIATTNPVEVTQLLVNHSYHVLAVVNGGDFLVDKPIENLTLGDLQQAVVQKIYDYDAPSSTSGSNPTQAGYTNFLMASADDEKPSLVILPSNSENRPAQTVIDVERVSARVDYRAQGSEGQKDGVYEVSSAPGLNPVEGKAKITGAMLMNVLDDEAPSWLLKRVADSWESTDVEYLGKEKADANGAASNYVIDAISSKTKDDFVQDTYFKNFNYTDLAWESQFIEGSLIENLDDDYNCIGYPKENVNQLGNKGLTTGVVFRAQYRPYINNAYLDENQTFFEYNGEVYATLNDLMQGFNKDNWDNFISKVLGTDWWLNASTWEDLQANIIDKLRIDPVGYRDYLALAAKGKIGDIKDEDKAKLRWEAYLLNECAYKVENNQVVVDANNEDGTTRCVLHETSDGQIRTFKEGICYYTYWIKHANDQDKKNDLEGVKDKTGGVMEYAIVRNNVYKLNVTSISGPGGDIPGDRNVNVNVLVEDWDLMPKEEIDLNPAGNTEEEGV